MPYAPLLLTILLFPTALQAATWSGDTPIRFAIEREARHVDHFAELSAASTRPAVPGTDTLSNLPQRLVPAYVALCMSLILVRLAPSARRRRQLAAAADAMSRTR